MRVFRMFPSVPAVFLLLGAACNQSPTSPAGLSVGASAGTGTAKPPADEPMTGIFRCPGAECLDGDRLLGDGSAYAATLNVNREFRIDLAGSRTLLVDFTDGPAPCAGCRRTFTTQTLSAANATTLQTNVVIPGTDTEASNGLLSIPVGATWPAKMKLIFNLPDAETGQRSWAVRFNPRDYPGSTHLNVTRLDATTWIIEATTAQFAKLVSIGGRRDGGTIDEGLYVMPFKITATRP